MAETTKKRVVVVEGARLNCSLGSLPTVSLKVKHKDDDKYYINEKKIATWLEDNKDHMDFGVCNRSSSKPKCTPNISWSDYYENAEFGKKKILIDQSKGTCKIGGGTVIIKEHGQSAQPSSRIYKKNKKDSYEIYMLSPKVAASNGKKLPSVSKIDLVVSPAQRISSNREVSFEIGGSIKSIKLVATVGAKDDKSLVSWAFYKGDNQKNRFKTYLEYGSELIENLEALPEGKTTIFGYGETPEGNSTKIIINRKHNKLEGISMKLLNVKLESVGKAPKNTQIVFSPKYTFANSPKLSLNQVGWQQKTKWNIKDEKGNILYTTAPGFSANRNQGVISTSYSNNYLTAIFKNNGNYQIELEDFSRTSLGMLPDIKTLSLRIVNRSARTIINKGLPKIRKEDSIHLLASGIEFDYGINQLGNRAFWHIQKDSGKTISLGLRAEVKMNVPELIEEFRKKQVIISNPYGEYKFRIDGEEKDVISIGTSSDTAVIEVAKNRMESISGPDKIPVGAVVTYKTKVLMSLVGSEHIRWIQPAAPFIKFNLSSDHKQATLQLNKPGKAYFSAYLEGEDASTKEVKKTVEATYIYLEKALWCYANGKRRAETGWEEENYIHVSLEGLSSIPVKLKVWVKHPDEGKVGSLSYENCLLKEIDSSLNGNGSLQTSFIVDKELKEKLQKIYPEESPQAKLFFTLEFTAGGILDLSKVRLIDKGSSEEIPFVEKQGKNLYFVLDADEDLKIPARPRITAINFSNEAGDDIQVGVTQYGKKHTIWVNTVGMTKEKLVVIVYKKLLKDDMIETYNNKDKAFAVTAQVKKYEEQEVGTDGLLELDFIPEKKDGEGDPQLFYISVFKKQKNEKDETILVEEGSQLKSLDSLPFDKELNEYASQVGIAMPTLEEGQSPTAEQLNDIVSKFFHFYNPLYVSETGTIEDQQVISPVLVERGNSNKKGECPRCKEDFTVDILKKVYKSATTKDLEELAVALNKYKEIFKLDTCARKAHFFAQSRQEAGLSLTSGLRGESFNYIVSGLSGAGLKAFEQVPGGKDIANKHARKNRSDPAVSESSQIILANWAYGYHYSTGKNFKNRGANDGWNFRGRGLFQITGRSTYEKVQKIIEAYAKDSGINIYKKYDSPDKAISVKDGWMTPEEAALTGMIDWFKDGMYLKADETGKISDDEVVNSIIKIINEKTSSYPERRVWYRGGKAGDLTVSESNSTKSIFRVAECGKVDEPLKYENSDLKIQEGIKWLLSKCIDQTEVNKKPYKVTYKNDDDRISEKGENTMDCSELVCRYLQKIEWSKKVMGGNTRILYEFAEKYPIYLQKHDDLDYKPQIGDIFIWKSSSGMGHTGVIIDYEEIPNKDNEIEGVVTTVEAISSSEIPYGMEKKLTMGGVIKLKWKKDSYHLLDHKVTAQRSPCRFYTPLIHYSKADKKVNWNKNNYSFEIIKK